MAAEEKEELSLAKSRPRRALAGRNIGKLIDQEQDGDDFYKSAYGGFEEESADEHYEEEDSEDDVVDSDFDVDESTWHMEVEEGEEQLEEKKKKKQWIKPAKPKQQTMEEIHVPASGESATKPPKSKKSKTTSFVAMGASEQRSLRKSTLVVSEEFRRRMQEEEEMRRLQRSRKSSARKQPLRRLTQQELLEEAKITERENLAALEAYARMLAEKKKVKEKVKIIQGPFVRFHSVTMPSIEELPDPVNIKKVEENRVIDVSTPGTTEKSSTDNVSTSKQNAPSLTAIEQQQTEPQKYCRNFLIFTDTLNYPSAFFPLKKPSKPRKRFCPVTGLPAKYMDPITGTPYATSHAFRIIRNRYISEGEQKCEKRLLQLSSWLEEKKRKKLEAKSY